MLSVGLGGEDEEVGGEGGAVLTSRGANVQLNISQSGGFHNSLY